MTRLVPFPASLAVLLLCTACPPIAPVELTGEQGEIVLATAQFDGGDGLVFMDPYVDGGPGGPYRGAGPLLAGTEACLVWYHATQDWAGEPPPTDEPDPHADDLNLAQECYVLTLDGPVGASEVGQAVCYTFDTGDTSFEFERDGCPEEDLQSDRIAVPAIDADAAQARLAPWPELMARYYGYELVFPAGVADPAESDGHYGEQIQVAAGQSIRIEGALVEAATGAWLGWNSSGASLDLLPTNGTVELVDAGGASDVGPGPYIEFENDGLSARVRLGEGATADVRLFAAGGQGWTAAQLVGVPASRAARMTVGVAVVPDEETDTGSPFGARAYVWDADGALIHGAPVRWSIGGMELALSTASDEVEVLAGPDYAELGDLCQPPTESAGRRSAVVRARLGALRAERTVAWVNAEDEDADDTDWEKPELCTKPGCGGCAVADRGPSPAWWLLLLPLVATARRRR
jgi:hypothetical protein